MISLVPNRFFVTWDLPLLKLGIRDFKVTLGRDSVSKMGTGLHETVGRDNGIEKPYWGPS